MGLMTSSGNAFSAIAPKRLDCTTMLFYIALKVYKLIYNNVSVFSIIWFESQHGDNIQYALETNLETDWPGNSDRTNTAIILIAQALSSLCTYIPVY